MMYDLSRTERQHRAINAETTTGALIPKRCACLLADRVATLQPEDLAILHHMLGATPHHAVARWGFRNHYLANRQDLPLIERLIAAGFVRAGEPLLQLQYFHATAAGCKLAGLSAKRVAVALGARP